MEGREAQGPPMSTRWKIPRKVCPVEDCSEPVRIDRIMCRDHWRAVDAKIKTAHGRAYRAWRPDQRNLVLLRAVRATHDACIVSAGDRYIPLTERNDQARSQLLARVARSPLGFTSPRNHNRLRTLAEQGLVERRRVKTGRAYFVSRWFLTPAGEAALESQNEEATP